MPGWVLVGMAAFFGLSSGLMWGWVLVGVAAFLGSEVVLAPFGSLHVGVGVAWCGCLQVFDQVTRFNLNLLKLFGFYAGVILQSSTCFLSE